MDLGSIEEELSEWTVVKNKRGRKLPELDVDEVGKDGKKWEKLSITMDSGAMESVIPKEVAKNIRTRNFIS